MMILMTEDNKTTEEDDIETSMSLTTSSTGRGQRRKAIDEKNTDASPESAAFANLENALLQGVVPVSVGVGSNGLVGDFGFDLLAGQDFFLSTQQTILKLIPKRKVDDIHDDKEQLQNPSSSQNNNSTARPKALILHDYREAEIRHGRLAMLAATF
jgi:hypothetical protein